DRAAHFGTTRRSDQPEVVGATDSILDFTGAGEARERQPFAEYIAEAERRNALQTLQAYHAEQFRDTGIHFQDLPVAQVDRHIAVERRKVDPGRAAVPSDFSGQRAFAAFQRARQAGALEQCARVFHVELEIDDGPAWRAFVGYRAELAQRAPVRGRG